MVGGLENEQARRPVDDACAQPCHAKGETPPKYDVFHFIQLRGTVRHPITETINTSIATSFI